MRAGIRQQIRVLYDYRCGYCGVRESDVGARLTVDHFCPRVIGGGDEIDNLVYCCHACNEFKGDYWPENENLRLLHPLRDDIAVHLAFLQDGTVQALTDRGANHSEQLRLNRPELVANRLQRQNEETLSRENQQILQILRTLQQENDVLRDQIADRDASRKRKRTP
jgi:uncharacterized protein (TIGR02646 family)